MNEIGGQEVSGPDGLATVIQRGECEHFLDHGSEVLRHRPHALENIHLALGQRTHDLIHEQLFVAGERRERRPQLVRHGREKATLGTIG